MNPALAVNSACHVLVRADVLNYTQNLIFETFHEDFDRDFSGGSAGLDDVMRLRNLSGRFIYRLGRFRVLVCTLVPLGGLDAAPLLLRPAGFKVVTHPAAISAPLRETIPQTSPTVFGRAPC